MAKDIDGLLVGQPLPVAAGPKGLKFAALLRSRGRGRAVGGVFGLGRVHE
jgi:hypothetical protein